jgi:endonuclease YncB( thermonuclease family)
MRRLMFLGALAESIAAMLATRPTTALERPIEGTAYVIDGDTIDVAGVRVRLYGVDAPERDQTCASPTGRWACGAVATAALRSLVKGRGVQCRAELTDAYQRTVATCWVSGQDIGAYMVRSGNAWAFRRYALGYVAEEQAARAARIGVWVSPTCPAWDYRSHSC